MKQIEKILNGIEFWVMCIGMGIMVLFNFLNVVSRKLMPDVSLSYTEELVVLIFLWISMFGISYAYRQHSHTGLNLITDHLPAKAKVVTVILSALCSALFVAIIAYTGFGLVQNHVKYGQILPSLQLPMAIQSVALPFGGIVVVLSVIVSAYTEVLEILGKKEEV